METSELINLTPQDLPLEVVLDNGAERRRYVLQHTRKSNGLILTRKPEQKGV